MLIKRFLDTLVSDSIGFSGKIANPYRFRPVAFNHDKEVTYLPTDITIDVPFFTDRKLTVAQLDLLLIQLLRSAKHSTSVDLLVDNPTNWRRLFVEMATELKRQAPIQLTKLAVLGNGLDRFHELFADMLEGFDFIEVFEHKALKTDIIILPVGMPIGKIVAKDSVTSKQLGMVVYEDFVKRLSFHNDDQMRNWLQLCTAQMEKETNGSAE